MKRTPKTHNPKSKDAPVGDKIVQDGSIGAVGAGGAMGLTVGAATGLVAGGLPGLAVGAAVGIAAGAIVAEAAMENITTETPLHPQKNKKPLT